MRRSSGHINYRNDITLVCSVVFMLSAFKTFTFPHLFVNVDFLFVHTQVVQVRHASNPLHSVLWTCQCAVIADVSNSVDKVMRGKLHL